MTHIKTNIVELWGIIDEFGNTFNAGFSVKEKAEEYAEKCRKLDLKCNVIRFRGEVEKSNPILHVIKKQQIDDGWSIVDEIRVFLSCGWDGYWRVYESPGGNCAGSGEHIDYAITNYLLYLKSSTCSYWRGEVGESDSKNIGKIKNDALEANQRCWRSSATLSPGEPS